ncbi:hypothetical protein, partial [Burkholderia gladioli]
PFSQVSTGPKITGQVKPAHPTDEIGQRPTPTQNIRGKKQSHEYAEKNHGGSLPARQKHRKLIP